MTATRARPALPCLDPRCTRRLSPGGAGVEGAGLLQMKRKAGVSLFGVAARLDLFQDSEQRKRRRRKRVWPLHQPQSSLYVSCFWQFDTQRSVTQSVTSYLTSSVLLPAAFFKHCFCCCFTHKLKTVSVGATRHGSLCWFGS